MTQGLIRYYGTRHLHFITCSCYRRQPQLHPAHRRDLFLEILGPESRTILFDATDIITSMRWGLPVLP